MIFGWTTQHSKNSISAHPDFHDGWAFHTDRVHIGLQRSDASKRNSADHLFISEDRQSALVFHGELYQIQGSPVPQGSRIPKLCWELYKQQGISFLNQLNGAFSLALWDGQKGRLYFARDQIGILQGFYSFVNGELVFGSTLRPVAQSRIQTEDYDSSALLKYLQFCYNPGEQTFFRDVRRLRPGHALEWDGSSVRLHHYWAIDFTAKDPLTEADVIPEIRSRLNESVRLRMEHAESKGVFLSGGLDSSSVLSLLSQNGAKGISTFSFRCKGQTFDESGFAKIVADRFGTAHHLVEYAPESVFLAEPMVSLMDEPFADVGINIATYLLAREAGGKVSTLYTGDGGDELFMGHPVYMADRMARFIDWAPRFLLDPFLFLGRQLKDSEKKNDWQVKIKRFSESYAFPKALGTHRWRAYYHPAELNRIVHPDLLHDLGDETVFDDMIRYNREGKASDAAGRTLYSDYQTVVQFYLRRMEMTRSFGLTPRFPMLDPTLVQYFGALPSVLKSAGYADTKEFEKKVVDPWLPHEIVYRKDKLGHSIPLKNWIRDDHQVRGFITDILTSETFVRRGCFKPETVRQMLDEHLRRTRNHSHRLWALVLLELWMRRKA